jgi:hypothetical protein
LACQPFARELLGLASRAIGAAILPALALVARPVGIARDRDGREALLHARPEAGRIEHRALHVQALSLATGLRTNRLARGGLLLLDAAFIGPRSALLGPLAPESCRTLLFPRDAEPVLALALCQNRFGGARATGNARDDDLRGYGSDRGIGETPCFPALISVQDCASIVDAVRSRHADRIVRACWFQSRARAVDACKSLGAPAIRAA